MKRSFSLVLLFCLSASLLLANAAGDLRFGVQTGYGREQVGAALKTDPKDVTTISWNGFDVSATGECFFHRFFMGKVSFGLNTMGRRTTIKASDHTKENSACPANYYIYAGVGAEYVISGKVGVGVGIGLDLAGGKMSSTNGSGSNVRMGLGMESSLSYQYTENLRFVLNSRYDMYFLNTDKGFRNQIRALRDQDRATFQSGLKVCAGVSFSLSANSESASVANGESSH